MNVKELTTSFFFMLANVMLKFLVIMQMGFKSNRMFSYQVFQNNDDALIRRKYMHC